MTLKQQKRLERQQGLLREFDHQEVEHYEERKIGQEYFVKNWNGGTGRWQVSIYSEESFQRYKSFKR